MPRPNLKIKLYFSYSGNALKGILMAVSPSLVVLIGLTSVFERWTYIQSIPGDHDYSGPLDP